MKVRTNIKPPRNRFKRFVVTAGFFALAKGLQTASELEEQIKNEISDWDDGFSFALFVQPSGPFLAMEKQGAKLLYLGSTTRPTSLTVNLKNMQAAYQMITTRSGIHDAYVQNKIAVEGQIPDAMTLIRIIYIIEDYLFPAFLAKNILKTRPKRHWKKYIKRLQIYSKIPFKNEFRKK